MQVKKSVTIVERGLHSNENEHWNLFWVMEQYDMIENRSKN
jgi:hypothetical protein